MLQQNQVKWIDVEVEFPDCDKIICYGDGKIFICEWIESKWGNFYYPTDCTKEEAKNIPDWTHWMPLPELPK